jgi:hypothetical protein
MICIFGIQKNLVEICILRKDKLQMSSFKVGESGIVNIMRDVVKNKKINKKCHGDLFVFF